MGLLGRILGGAVGDWLEDEINGEDDDENEDENIVIRKIRKIRKYTGRRMNIPGMPGPIVAPLPDLSDLQPRGRSLLETIFNDPIKRLPAGCILCCDLAGAFEHSGVYVGRRRIIHRDGDGFLASVSPEEFLDRLGGFNNAISIFVACDEDGDPVGGKELVDAARAALKKPKVKKGYNLVTKNCHQFCRYCITGESGHVGNFTFTSLEKLLKRELGFSRWRRWAFDD